MTAFERKVVHDAVAAAGLQQRVRGRGAPPLRGRPPRLTGTWSHVTTGAEPCPAVHVKRTAAPDDRLSRDGRRRSPPSATRPPLDGLIAVRRAARDGRGRARADRSARGPAAVGAPPAQLRRGRGAGPAGRDRGRRRLRAPACPVWCWRSSARTCRSRWSSRCCAAATFLERGGRAARARRTSTVAAGPGRGAAQGRSVRRGHRRGRSLRCDQLAAWCAPDPGVRRAHAGPEG